MAVQHRRGNYSQFIPSKLVAGEIAFVTSGDPNTNSGTAVYVCFGDGDVQRFATAEEAERTVENFIASGVDKEVVNALIESRVEARLNEIFSKIGELDALIGGNNA